MRMQLRSLLCAALLILPIAHARAYPDKPVKIVIPFLPGGTADQLMRLVAVKASALFGQPVVVENRAGAGGNIGANEVARAPADGYTLLFTPPGPLAINQHLFPTMPYDARTAFRPVSILATMPSVLVVGPGIQAGTLPELAGEARKTPGTLTYASQGFGTTTQLLAELFAIKAGVKLVHVPYKGAPPIVTDLRSGRVGMVFFDSANAIPQLSQNADLRALAVTGMRRNAALPNVPTFEEAGVTGMNTSVWMGLAAPAHTPDPVVEAWHAALAKIVAMPDVRQRIQALGAEPWASTPAEMLQVVEQDSRLWAEVIRATGAANR